MEDGNESIYTNTKYPKINVSITTNSHDYHSPLILTDAVEPEVIFR